MNAHRSEESHRMGPQCEFTVRSQGPGCPDSTCEGIVLCSHELLTFLSTLCVCVLWYACPCSRVRLPELAQRAHPGLHDVAGPTRGEDAARRREGALRARAECAGARAETQQVRAMYVRAQKHRMYCVWCTGTLCVQSCNVCERSVHLGCTQGKLGDLGGAEPHHMIGHPNPCKHSLRRFCEF